MKKVLAASVAVLLLTGSVSSLAATKTYTDLDSGFKLKAQPSWMEIGGKNFFGLADKPDKRGRFKSGMRFYRKRSGKCYRQKVYDEGIYV